MLGNGKNKGEAAHVDVNSVAVEWLYYLQVDKALNSFTAKIIVFLQNANVSRCME